jgi:hypothetical protein
VRLCVCAALALPTAVAAQRPARDTAVTADSLDPDSLRPPLPRLGPPPGPLPAAQRVVFTRDDLDWLGARSLGELLAFVPGAFHVRAGWFGLPEFIGYAGQGAAGIELYLDGFLLAPLGEDGAALDLARFDIGLLQRVEVEVLPTLLRVYLVSDVGTVRRPRTEASFATGDAETNTYRGRYLNRWANGAGLGIAASYFATDGPSTSPSAVNTLTIWAKGTWTPAPLVGVEYSYTTTSIEREALQPTGTPPLPALNADRRDAFVRAYAATREGGMGLRFDALFGTSRYTDSTGTLDGEESQAAAVASYRAATWALEATTRLRSGATPRFFQARASWAPARRLTLAAYGQTARRLGSERLTEGGLTGELRVLPRVRAHGALRWRDWRTDTAQTITDWDTGLAMVGSTGYLGLSVQRHGPFRAPAFPTLEPQLPRATTVPVTTITVAYRLAPRPYLTLHGWYRHPLDPQHAAFEPPHHTRTALAFRSRFLPRLRRGAFDLLVQAELEGWGDGIAGLDASGTPIRLEGATVVNYLVEFRLVGAILFWTFRNPQLERYAIVPGFAMPRGLQRFGVRWEFAN